MTRVFPKVQLPIGYKFLAAEGDAEIIGDPIQRIEFGIVRHIWDYPCRVKVNGRRRRAIYVFNNEGRSV